MRAKDGKKIEHTGIKVEFLGQIGTLGAAIVDALVELYQDRGKPYEFLALQQELATPGDLRHTVSYDFEFKNVEKQYESYLGVNVKLRQAFR